jgi:hypothetical protein
MPMMLVAAAVGLRLQLHGIAVFWTAAGVAAGELSGMSIDGEVSIDYAVEGFTWTFACPADKALERG